MPTIVDQYHGDPLYSQLHVLTRDYPRARALLKTASFDETKTAVVNLPSTAFAWEAERRFPVHTREDTVASLFYRKKCASAVPSFVDDKLSAAAQIFNIDRGVFSTTKVASAMGPVEYALPDEKRLPLSSRTAVKLAEERLLEDYEVLSLEKRATAFQNLYHAARRLQVELKPKSLKMAGVTGSNTQFIREWLEARATVAPNESTKVAYTKLASAVNKLPNYLGERATLVKLAATIAQLDEHAGLKKYYDRKLPDPLQTVFNLEKVAEEVVDVAGAQVPVSALMSLPPEVWAQVDAPELSEVAQRGDPEQFAQVFATLPLDVKATLRGQVG